MWLAPGGGFKYPRGEETKRRGEAYVKSSDWHQHRQQEDDADEQSPDTSPRVDQQREPAHVPRPGPELPKHHLAEDGDDVGPIQGDGADVEDTRDGGVRAQPDQIDSDAPERGDPDRVQGRTGDAVDLGPDVAEREETIAGEGEDGSGERLHGGEADEFEDDEAADGVEDPSRLAEGEVEDLSNGLGCREDDGRVGGHAEAEDDVEEESTEVGEQHGERDGPWCLDFWLRDLFGDVSGRIVIRHGP